MIDTALRRAARHGTTALLALGLSSTLAACSAGPDAADRVAVGPADGFEVAAAALERFILAEMEDKALPAVSIAVVDDQRVVWARGFGRRDPETGAPATAETVYRVGSVSKLFTDIAVMQLVEQGRVDLDAPITDYLPEFRPENPFGGTITLRHLMSHRAGLVREPPVGHYFDDTAPTLAATVASLNGTALVYPPGERTKYSNAGIAAVGYVLERLTGEPFADYVARSVLVPLGLERSGFEPRPDIERRLARAYMWTYHGTRFDAPGFQLGMAPAGSMYSTVLDLGRFMSALFAGGQGEAGRILEPATLDSMWTPQFAPAGRRQGFGIGFAVSELDGRRRIGHNGAIYGFATELAALPDEKLGVAVTISLDGANAVAGRIADATLRSFLAAREGAPLPVLRRTEPVPAALALRLEGAWGRDEPVIELVARGDALYLVPERGGVRARLRTLGDTLIADDRIAYGTRILAAGDRLVVAGDTLRRLPARRPAPVPDRWAGLIGEYGWDHDVLYVLERHGRLYALIEWFFLYPLEEVSPDHFRFPGSGLYPGERLVFRRDGSGRATAVEAAGIVFARRSVGPEDGGTFRITPVRPVEALRREALAATPPRETGEFRAPELVELTSLDPTLRLDIRYATTNNFMGAVFYDEPRAFLQRPAAEALVRAHARLKDRGYCLLIHDAYRPWYVTRMFWDATPEGQKVFVADPSQGSRHNRGAAVDLTLCDLETGRPIEMVGGYDEFTDRSYPDYPGGTAAQRWHRELLRDAMEAEGFTVYDAEWWHFDFRDWRHYPILNLTFDRIGPAT